ncbi:efflux RND transporter periplasmic adaptor subunit [Salidesulfovibrio onnuriiensis]|uniref:efflux RND transporter periplasmic adaptor subunit n=1 Tax=Salidesulfovibrio onnuriiensis TaxID=2583823 RepID=UPI0011C6FB9F|nr:efflux RND transporter periplasmic adaptor subunit [Salidesulfovibrio onnuriiensis]
MAALRHIRLAGFCLSLFAVLALPGCTGEPPKQERPPVPVTLIQARAVDSERVLKAVGTVKASNSVTLQSQVTGQILRIHFLDGDRVEVGQVLYTIDPESYAFSEQGAQADVARDRAQAEQARKEFLRFKALYAQDAVSKDEFEQKRTAYEAAQRAMEADLAQAGIAGRNLKLTKVTAPIDGIAGSTRLDEGNLVTAEQSDLVVIKTVEPVDVVFSIPGRYLTQVRSHDVNESLVAYAVPPGKDHTPSKGELTFVDNWINTATGMIDLKARFSNADERLWPGQFVEVTLVLGSQSGTYVIPAQAVQKGPDGTYLFVADGAKAAMKPVVVDMRKDDDVIITKGLAEGDRVITEGMFMLAPGTPVREVEKGEAAKAGGAS